ncbi:hypothetical protein V7S43_007832 [Phytophthora oleae]|uniref:FHA domain-containing protein n=1 Tax=Phytophthora oleae TaxID=2107226 RepID=A0ABD3FJD4_9STRA
MASSLLEAKLLPWGRLVLVTSNNNSSVPDHFDLLRSKHRVGRVTKRSDLLITRPFISGLHCTIQLRGKDGSGEPIVEIEDHSSHGTYLNGKKIGLRRSAKAKKGDRINFSAPGAAGVAEIAYKLEILPSGLTKQNEDLHARLSADEMSVAGRTRKRIHEELQSTQSPTKVVVSPPRPRPVKKLRVVSLSQQSSQEHESGSTFATQQSAQDSAPHPQPSKASGKRRRRPDDKTLEELQKENVELRNQYAEVRLLLADNTIALTKKSKELAQAQKEVESLQKENAAMKKAHEEELKKIKDQAAADLAKKDEDMKRKVDEVVQERNMLKETVDLILADPTKPQEVRTIAELVKAIHELERRKKVATQDLAMQKHLQDQTETTPPSKKQIAQIELTRHMQVMMKKDSKAFVQVATTMLEMAKRQEAYSDALADPSNLSGSSQSQDSIDAGQIRRGRRSSQLSVASNEHSEPSPPDVFPTIDKAEETNIDATSPRIFDRFGAVSATSNRPDTMSRTQVYRAGEQRTQRQQGTVEAEETKRGEEETPGQQGTVEDEDEETKGGDEETKGNEDEETKGE